MANLIPMVPINFLHFDIERVALLHSSVHWKVSRGSTYFDTSFASSLFSHSLQNELSSLNMEAPGLEGSLRYIQATFDQAKTQS